ncbi:hypothetical protein [Amniculibacterium sp. G2-70]|uniref:hypothetical protein n=1 Tax=Amniculibacterium sp. G2-70 TaxID=2767188 RepID=UPI001653FCD3|nr:hypothetical protein [Amniculibacterium sp. G2-70]
MRNQNSHWNEKKIPPSTRKGFTPFHLLVIIYAILIIFGFCIRYNETIFNT